jgi:hypothetical protein
MTIETQMPTLDFTAESEWYKSHFEGQKRLPRKYKKRLKHEYAVKLVVKYTLVMFEQINKPTE